MVTSDALQLQKNSKFDDSQSECHHVEVFYGVSAQLQVEKENMIENAKKRYLQLQRKTKKLNEN